MLQLQLQSEDGYFLILALQGYEKYSSTPFTFALNVQLAGFSSRQVLQLSRAYAGSFNQWSLDFDYSTLQQFRDDLQHLNELAKEQAVLSNADETFQLAICPYGKRGYLLAKVTMQYNIVPKMQDEISILHRFEGGFVSEPGAIGEWIEQLTQLFQTYPLGSS